MEYKGNPKKTWDVSRTLLPSKSISPAPNSANVDGINISDPGLIAEKFNTHFANVDKLLASRLNSNDKNSFLTYLKFPCPSSVYLYPTSPQEIFTLINNLNLNKARGYDDISPFILKTAAHIVALPLSILLNHCNSFGVFPNQLKIAKVVPVYKSGPPEDLHNYRPISLLSTISKIFERVIPNRLVSFMERKNLIIATQFGFRHKHSTIHPTLDLITKSYQNIDNKRFSILLFLDMKKAFDSVCLIKLIKKLEYHGIRGVANNLLESYLHDRTQYVAINYANSKFVHIKYGVSQGSILAWSC